MFILPPWRCKWLPLLHHLLQPTQNPTLLQRCLQSQTTLPGKSFGYWDFSAEKEHRVSEKEPRCTKVWKQQAKSLFFLKKRIVSLLSTFSFAHTILLEHQTCQWICRITHPWTGIFTLVAHQDVKKISFLQRKYGWYEYTMVTFVVILGSFSSGSPIGRNAEGDHRTTNERKKFPFGLGSEFLILLDK